MSHAIHKTEAIVMRLIPQGEANFDGVFLTRDFGKITARVQAARKIESKHRMQIARYNHVIVDLVQGKSIWRVTGIHEIQKHRLFTDNGMLSAWHRAVGLAEHLIRGEEPHVELFDFFMGLLNFIDEMITEQTVAYEGEMHFFAKPGGDGREPLRFEKNALARSKVGLRTTNDFAEGFEIFSVIKVLDHLGYWQGEKFPEMPSDEIIERCFHAKSELVGMINEGIKGSQIT